MRLRKVKRLFLKLHSQLVTDLSTTAKLTDLKAFSVFVHERVLESRCGQDLHLAHFPTLLRSHKKLRAFLVTLSGKDSACQ